VTINHQKYCLKAGFEKVLIRASVTFQTIENLKKIKKIQFALNKSRFARLPLGKVSFVLFGCCEKTSFS
jgi:hypothetical protein